MPVIRPVGTKTHTSDLEGVLRQQILSELLYGASEGGPLIYEIPTGPPGMVDVIVMWDAWLGISPEVRGSIIRDAYAEYLSSLKSSRSKISNLDPKGPSSVSRPGTVIGATWEEDQDLNLLPFSIRPGGTYRSKIPAPAKRFMVDLGAAKTPMGLALRFPTQELAGQAMAALEQKYPEGKWAILVRSDPIAG